MMKTRTIFKQQLRLKLCQKLKKNEARPKFTAFIGWGHPPQLTPLEAWALVTRHGLRVSLSVLSFSLAHIYLSETERKYMLLQISYLDNRRFLLTLELLWLTGFCRFVVDIKFTWGSTCSDEGLTLETSAKHHIPQATNILYQPLLIKPISSVLAHAEKQISSKLVFQCLSIPCCRSTFCELLHCMSEWSVAVDFTQFDYYQPRYISGLTIEVWAARKSPFFPSVLTIVN